MMHDWMMNGWGMGLGFIFWLLTLGAVVAGIIWLVRSPGKGWNITPRSSGLDLLEERYARGEITREEYLEKKRDMTQ